MSYWLRCASSVMAMMSERSDKHRIRLARLAAKLLDQRENVALVILSVAPLRCSLLVGPHILLGVEWRPVAWKVLLIWSSSSSRSVTITKLQLPGSLRNTFWVKNTIDSYLPEPCVCQNTPRRLPLGGTARAQLHQSGDGVVHTEELVVLGHLLDQATLHLLEHCEVFHVVQ